MNVRMWIVMAVTVVLCQAASANLLLNSDFALPGAASAANLSTVDLPSWTDWGPDGWYANDIGSQMSVKFWTAGNSGIYQDWDATPGDIFTLSVDAYTTSGEKLTTEAAYLKIEWLNSSYISFTNTELDFLTSSDPADSWHNLSGIVTAPVSTVHGRITLGLSGVEGTGAAFFDNANVSPIPEPGTLALFGLGIVGLWRLGRRVRS